MENPAGSSIRHKFRKEGRPTNRRNDTGHLSLLSGRSVSRENGNNLSGVTTMESEHSDERTSLLPKPWQHENAFVRWPAYFGLKTWQTLTSNYVNVLLVFVPLGIISGAVGWSPTATFVLNFLAIIPLASLLSFATEELALKLGQTLGGLLNATFGNAVELIVRISSIQGKNIGADEYDRLVSSPSKTAKFASCKPACSVPFSPIYSSSLAAASSLAVSATGNRLSMAQSHQPCPPSWPFQLLP